MISWGDVYKVTAALVPLLVALFAIPFFTFGFTVHTDPFHANYRAIAADVVSKAVVAAAIAAWWLLFARGRGGGADAAVNWSITGFSLSTLTSSLVVGVPMARAMYGEWAQQLVVQLSVFQAIVWITLLLFALEVRKAALGGAEQQIHHHQNQIINDIEASTYAAGGDDDASTTTASSVLSQPPPQAIGVQASNEAIAVVVMAEEKVRNDDAIDDGTEIVPADDPDSSRHSTTARAQGSPCLTISDVDASTDDDDAAYVDASSSTLPQSPLANDDDVEASNTVAMGVAGPAAGGRPSMWTLVKVVLYKLGRNPNTYASVGGIIWACIANRYTRIPSHLG
ncbi:unnamed protein product [Urochloa decumbens]|uniref:PIN-like protein n=1 Tax=Urochloa decumbens TaxID=240449 RepID=A0ABC9GQR2_9POAL